jgi:tRNA U34 5-carboxymethylaminomethyl modifying GTPase MnmE/TrmE
MRDDLITVLDLMDRAVAAAKTVIPESSLEPVAQVTRRVRDRVGLLGESVLVALAGGTGSGKSSLLNALAGEEVCETGTLRPTTARPVAWVPAQPDPELLPLLDRMGIDIRVPHQRHRWLAVIDLPDTDSLEIEHRRLVDRLLPHLDLVVWVVDPEKYADRVLHHHYLRPRLAHQDRFIFVLNQIDRMSRPDRGWVAADLAAALEADGVRTPLVFLTAADPPAGPLVGIEAVLEHLEEMAAAKGVVADRLVIDLRQGSELLKVALPSTSFGRRWEETRTIAAGLLGQRQKREARQILESFFGGLNQETGLVTEDLNDLVPQALKAAARATDKAAVIDRLLGRPLRDRLRPRGQAVAAMTDLELALAGLEQKAGGRARRAMAPPLSSPWGTS